MTSMEEFAVPGEAVGFSFEEHNGDLLLISPHGVEEGIVTSFGEKEAVRATIRVIDGDDAGTIYDDSLVFPKVLIGQLRSKLGEKVLGRLMQGLAKPGQKPPWKLTEATSGDIAIARSALRIPGRPAGGSDHVAVTETATAYHAPTAGASAPAADPLAGMDDATLAALAALAAKQAQGQ